MEKEKIFQEMSTLWAEFVTSHEGTTKRSQAVARKKIGDLKKLVTAYRKASVDEQKADN